MTRAAPVPSAAPARSPRSTMEFLFELDAPAGPVSRELDLRTMPDVTAALAAAGARASLPDLGLSDPPFEEPLGTPSDAPPDPSFDATEAADAIEGDTPGAAPAPTTEFGPLPEMPADLPRIVLKPQPAARTPEEQHEQRKRRLITRLVTCRDSFRVLGFLDLRDTDRKEVARLLMGLDEALDPGTKSVSVAKDPSTALAHASKDTLDRIERLISPIEDKLLALDETVVNETFNARASAGKITAKALARYGRLLASRRMQAGQRRDRFEWIATMLLTRTRADGAHELVSPERAAQALELLIGGLPYKPREQELEEALRYLGDSLQRLMSFKDQEAFFDSEYFLDVHGYKVSMREQLLCPDFVYLSAAINAQLHNRIEQWIGSVERLHNANQLTQEGSPREQFQRRLREEEDAVANIFGVKPRAVAQAPVRAESRRKEPELKKPAKRAKKKRKSFAFSFDRRLVQAVVMLIVILGSGLYLALETGTVSLNERADVARDKLKAMSPLIVRATVEGSGKHKVCELLIQRPGWRDMRPEARRTLADRIARGLGDLGIKKARVVAGKVPVIEIEQGLVTRVQLEAAPKP